MKAIKILEALEIGIPITIDDCELALSEDNLLCHVFINDKDEEVLLKSDITVCSFIKMCEKMSTDDYDILKCNIALNRYKQSMAKDRSEKPKFTPKQTLEEPGLF